MALEKAELGLKDIDAIAVSANPGLIGSLLVGVSFAKGLAFSLKKPLIAVNHIFGHVFANFLEHKDIKFPFLVAHCFWRAHGTGHFFFSSRIHNSRENCR